MGKRSRDDAHAQIRKAYEDLQKAHDEIKDAHMAIVLKLAIIAEFRDRDTGTHVMRISDYGCEICKVLGLTEKEIEIYRFASPMHDIGKIAIPDAILKKEGILTPDEFEVMKTHTIIGSRMFDSSSSAILKAAAEICLSHHEKWDGTGYPYGLKGEKIPLFGRILAIVDVFDALVSKRCYKDAWPFDETVKYIQDQSGKHFYPHGVNAMMKVLPQFKQIYMANRTIQSFIADYGIFR